MSRIAAPEKPRTSKSTTQSKTSYRRAATPRRRPVAAPIPVKRVVKTKAKARARRTHATPNWMTQMSAAILHVFIIAIFVFVVSSLTGNAFLEKARRERLQLQERANRATTEVSLIRRSVDESSNLEAIERFATSRGLIRGGDFYAPKVAVATPDKVYNPNASIDTTEKIFANAR